MTAQEPADYEIKILDEKFAKWAQKQSSADEEREKILKAAEVLKG